MRWEPLRTKVINVYGRDRASLLADPGFVYVGLRAREGWTDSPWGNPFRVAAFKSDYVADDVAPMLATQCFVETIFAADRETLAIELERYGGDPPDIETLWKYREFVRSNIVSLRGKTLGCVCCDVDAVPGTGWGPGQACHAVVLARILEGKWFEGPWPR